MESVASAIGRGLLAGAWGVLGMAGVSFTARRLVEPTKPIGKTHYESVVERANAALDTGTDLTDERRIRLGEGAHVGFGAFWGAVLAVVSRTTPLRPWRDGILAGTGLWLAAFGGYMPALGISRSLAEMGPYERFRTWISHAVFAVTTLHVLSSARGSSR